MNENLDLTKILEGCPEGTEFYSSVYGNLKFVKISFFYSIIMRSSTSQYSFSIDGRLYSNRGECTIFPSEDQRDWSKFERFWDKPKVERFDPKIFEPFDKVLSRYGTESNWMCTFFSHIIDKVNPYVDCNGITVHVCIPYNDDTKHLVGTTDEAPEYYRYWKD